MTPTNRARRVTWRAMGSEVEMLLVLASSDDTDRLVALATDRLAHYEQRWSRFVSTSDLSLLNLAGGRPLRVDPSTVVLVTAMVDAWWATSGRYDPTLLPRLIELGYRASWDDPTKVSHIDPASSWRATAGIIEVDPIASVVRLPAGTTLDPGGIGKGLAADLVVDALLDAGALGAMVAIGGDLRVAGEAPYAGGWLVDVADPHSDDDDGGSTGRLFIADGGVATSGTTERHWTAPTGEAVHHVLNPRTGQPSPHTADGDIVSATVVAGTGAWADAWAKAAMVDWSSTEHELDELGLGAFAVTASGQHLANASWAHLAVAATPAGAVGR